MVPGVRPGMPPGMAPGQPPITALPPGLMGPQQDPMRTPPPPANMRPARHRFSGHLVLGEQQNPLADALAPDDDELPPELEPYEAGLRPFIPPGGTPWVEEIVFDTIRRDDNSIEKQFQDYFTQARSYDERLKIQRIEASDYYNGKPLGDEEDGRSKLVVTSVRDTILATLPSLLRIFTGVHNPVEFVPEIADDEALGLQHAELARTATQYARWAIYTANPGWVVLHDAIKDALTRKVGWIRWQWGAQRAQRIEVCDRMLAPQLQALLMNAGIVAQRIARRPMLPNEQRAVMATPEGALYLQQGGEPVFYSATITRTAARAWPVIEAVPSESVWIVDDADSVANARAVFHVRDVTVSDLIAAGLPREEIEDAASDDPSPGMRSERRARDPASGQIFPRDVSADDPSMKIVRYVEGWILADTDGDGIAERLHCHGIGSMPKLIRWDRTDQVPLAALTPYREPQRVIGLSQADMVMDIQRTETRVTRGILDSLGMSLYPRTVVQVPYGNIEDARQTQIGAIIRVSQQGAVSELSKPFIGNQALPIMELLEATRESRTGITRTSQGLTAESLQSTTPVAVNAQTSAAQDRIEMIARTMAETGLVPLYRGLLQLMATHQDRPSVISLRGKWLTIDPRALNLQWAVQINVGGHGTPQERIGMLSAIAAKQEQILAPAIQQGMLDTPIVGLPEYRNTLARMCEAAGISDVVTHFKELPPGWQPPLPPPPQPSVEQVLAQVETLKTQASIADDTRQAQTDRWKLLLDDERSRDEAAVTAWVTAYNVAATHGTPLPSIADFKNALKSDLPTAAMLAAAAPAPPPGMMPPQAIPAPGGPVPPALGVPAMFGRGQPAGGPPGAVRPGNGAAPVLPAAGRPMPPAALPLRPQMLPPMLPPGAPPTAPPGARPPMDPASVLAVRSALARGGDPAAGLLQARALAPR
jgi:hypothetical protein